MLIGGYIKLARASMRTSRWRSLLTMLGIIVGIVSVVTTVSIGEGVKQQVVNQINERGDDLITVVPGQTTSKSTVQYFSRFSTTPQPSVSLGDAEYKAVQSVKSVKNVVPFGHVTGEVRVGESEEALSGLRVIASSQQLPNVILSDIEFGSIFSDEKDPLVNPAVIGQGAAKDMFNENVPLGKQFTIRGTRFVVRGVFKEFAETSPLLSIEGYDNAIFIPYRLGQELMGGNMQVYQILARARTGPEGTSAAIADVSRQLSSARGGAEDFSVLKQSETLSIAEETLTLLTTMIAGVAAISLIVGGIGIMNVMLVSVTERTREIGVRKAVGATNRQIMYQFITEAAVLSFNGGILGIFFSVLVNFALRITTQLEPVITLPAMAVAVGVSFAVGIIFGAAPAYVAARKDPIDSLRYQ